MVLAASMIDGAVASEEARKIIGGRNVGRMLGGWRVGRLCCQLRGGYVAVN